MLSCAQEFRSEIRWQGPAGREDAMDNATRKECFFYNQSVLILVVPLAVIGYLHYGKLYGGFWLGLCIVAIGGVVSAVSVAEGVLKFVYRIVVVAFGALVFFASMQGGNVFPGFEASVQAMSVMLVICGLAVADGYRVKEAAARTTATPVELAAFYGVMPFAGITVLLGHIAGAEAWFALGLLCLTAVWQAGFSIYLEDKRIPGAQVSLLHGGKSAAG